jgi:hypothetical protein
MKPYYKSQFKKVSEREIKKDLENIYEDDSGRLIDISRLEPTRKRGFLRFLMILALVLLVLVAVAWSGFWVFSRYAPDQVKQVVTDSGEVELTISGPSQVDSGDEVKYVIEYKNKKKVALNNLSLNIRYPSGLLLGTIKPQPRTKETSGDNIVLTKEDNWDLGSLAKGESGTIEISGRLIAESGSNQNLWAILYYEPENFSSRFQREASYTTAIALAPVEVSVSGTDQLATSKDVDLTLTYVNKADYDLADVLIEVDYPESFNLASTEPSPLSGSNNQWPISVLEKGDKGEIKIKGKFAANVAGSQDFIIQTSLKEGENKEYFLISKTNYSITIVSGELLAELKINSSSDNGTANFGDTLSYSLTYQNNSQDIMEDLSASVFFSSSSDFIQWTSLNDRYEGVLDEFEAGKILTWIANEVPNLKELKPGEKGVIDFSVRLASNAAEMGGDLSLQSVASIQIGKIDGKEVKVENKSNAVITKVNSNLNLSAYGLYFNNQGISVGSGPIPPKVGQTTQYVINWELSNSVHEVRDITVSMALPASVSWVGKKDITAGDLEYQPESRSVVWTINRMPTTINLDYRISFEVSITPKTSDAGKILALTGDINLTGTDQVTSAKISQTAGSITTDLVKDSMAKGKGLVEK